ncbi:ATP phosphoribosyltransferase regulatory subunit [Bosea thiooxidans]|uniref:ATP phosphoribosyltransferase regulatory subunit n=1 Tax=Bosea thiooxidans TaxID=53254 RepID=A0A0Q3I898_9HYPH|nr:ATP phosphoribosyltransferase regulatory subunit [Bosea thiooxidans]KQK31093.1 ATP phosphoribosyltransferase regulatory subunit [Bosea thiooxidans]SKB90292.1 ATP phosphoribosyltransferase regulatory subunit [Bosea thiooxidans]
MPASRARIETIIALFAGEGYARAEPAILQPADVFLDLSGEDIRRRIFMTQDADGRDWCLRPEYTIPVALDHIASGSTEPAAYAYAGPVFRMRTGEPGEFQQAGIESFGRADFSAADAEIMALTIEATAALGLKAPRIAMGDVALLGALLDGLAVPQGARRRLVRAVVQGRSGSEAVAALDPPAAEGDAAHAGLLKALEGQDPKAARVFVEDVLSIAGISTVGGRSAGDIAERFLARAAERENPVNGDVKALLEQVLAVSGDPDTASASLRALADQASLDLGRQLDAFDERTGFLAARGVDVGAIRFSAGFARNLDYYTGFIFELHDSARGDGKPVAGGGRYDNVLGRLGAGRPIPAVGASLWLDRLTGDAA